jgi:hypothetical protein
MGDRGGGRIAWPYPLFLRGSETREDLLVEIEIDAELWTSFESEAEAQSVTVEQLTEHAAFYFAAAHSGGGVAERILDDLEREGS